MIPSWARVGAKVVCINLSHIDGCGNDPIALSVLEVGHIYTIRGVDAQASGKVGVWLNEVTNPVKYDGVNKSFSMARFRPLITQQDDIETHFRALLDAPQSVEA